MRLPIIAIALACSVPAASQAPAPSSSPASDTAAATSAVVRSNPVEIDRCRTTRAHFAKSRSVWSGPRLRPEKLDELPRGTAYMAVYRTIDGCEMPMTVAEYRDSAAR